MPWKDATGSNLKPPLRPIQGNYGNTVLRVIKLYTNYYPVTVQVPDLDIYHYDVNIVDWKGHEVTSKIKKKEVFEALKKNYKGVFAKKPIGFDGVKNAYGIGAISELSEKNVIVTWQVTLATEARRNKITPFDDKTNGRSGFKVSMQLVGEPANLKDLLDSFKTGGCTPENSLIMQMCEVMFRHYRAVKYNQIGRCFFGLENEFGPPHKIRSGNVVQNGFFASLRPARWKGGQLLLNMDLAHAVFYEVQPVIQFLYKSTSVQEQDLSAPFKKDIREQINHQIQDLKVSVTHTNYSRKYKVLSVTDKGSNSLKLDFKSDDGTIRNITVADYFRNKYRRPLKYPNASCLHVGKLDRDVYLPLEVCHIAKGQKVQKKRLTDEENSELIKHTAIIPQERQEKIKEIFKANEFHKDELLQAMHFKIEEKLLETEGIVLPAPNLTIDSKSVKPRDGVWKTDGLKFHIAATLQHWAVIKYHHQTNDHYVRKFIENLVKGGRERGMVINEPYDIYTDEGADPVEDFDYYKRKYPKLQLVVCILSGGSNKQLYARIKQAGDREIGLITQCVKGPNVQKCHWVTLGNILLKINVKLGGINNIVEINPDDGLNFNEPVLVMGADVNHAPAGGADSIPSFAAVVGSCDRYATKYSVEVRAQEPRKEVIKDFAEITRNLLTTYYKKTGKKPRRILVYRDGVSESQFSDVLYNEMMQIRKACTAIEKGYTPGITYICVQKRHHTRLFGIDPRDRVGKSGNVPPGTVVDKDITHPTQGDFFLCSHQGIQGTSKPAHYHVLWDDNDLSMSDLQAITYKLCHVYARCSRSVSIPAPAYYAHHAAYRAKVHACEKVGRDASMKIPLSTYQQDAIVTIHTMLHDEMYWM